MAIFVLGMFADIQKERGILPVTRPTYRGSGIALIVRTSNAEAHAVCIYASTRVESQWWLTTMLIRILHTHERHCCFVV